MHTFRKSPGSANATTTKTTSISHYYFRDRRKSEAAILFLGLLSLSFLLVPAVSAGCAITNVTHRSDSASRLQTNVILLTWSTTDCQNVIHYKIYPKHLRYLACRQETIRSEQDQSQVLVTGENSYRLKTLIAHSEYSVRISAIMADGSRAEKTIQMSTLQDYPETRAELSTSETQSYLQALRFFWNPPSISDCRNQRGILSGYRLVLSGLDPWVLSSEPISTHDVDEHIHEYYFEKLKAFTNYKLEIYTKNKGDLVSKNYPLKLKARTLPTAPKPPTDLKLSPSANSVHLSWSPPYPPTGRVEMYVMRIGVNGSSKNAPVNWQRREEIPANRSCIKGVNTEANDKTPICHVVTGLEPGTLYMFEIQTLNADVASPSQFGNAVLVTTEPANIHPSGLPEEIVHRTTTERTAPQPNYRKPRADLNRRDSETSTLIVVLGLVVAIIALIVICTALVYKIKMNKLKMRYEQQNTPGGGGGDGSNRLSNSTALTYLPAGSDVTNMSFIQSWTNSIEEIQSRRLPEPPPSSSHDTRRHSGGYAEMSGVGTGYSSVDDRANLRTPPPARYIREDSTTDLDGYLKPTFNAEEKPKSSSTPKPSPTHPPPPPPSTKVIPAKSYEAPEAVVNRSPMQILGIPENNKVIDFPSFDSGSTLSSGQLRSSPNAALSQVPPLSESQQPLMLPKSVQV